MNLMGSPPSVGECGGDGSHRGYSPHHQRELSVTAPFTRSNRTDRADQCPPNDHQRGGGDCTPTTRDWVGLRGEGDTDCDEKVAIYRGDLQLKHLLVIMQWGGRTSF
jgi:hypothetical protein